MNSSDTPAVKEHERFMRRCIELAEIARSRNNTPVGSVVVLNGEIVGEGSEDLPMGVDVTGHAEVRACQAAVDRIGSTRLDRATLYSTAEPCFMCSYVVRQSGVSLVVYGVETPDVGGITSSHPILTDPRLSDWRPAPSILAGVLRRECEKLKSIS